MNDKNNAELTKNSANLLKYHRFLNNLPLNNSHKSFFRQKCRGFFNKKKIYFRV